MSETMNNDWLSWDDEIQSDGEYTLLPEGDYDFTVRTFERGRTKKGAPMAMLKIEVSGEEGSTTVSENIALLKSVEWKISSFFRAVGLKKHGEKVAMRWNDSVGRSGRCHVVQEEFIGNDGKARKSNKINRYYDHEETRLERAERLERELNPPDGDVPW